MDLFPRDEQDNRPKKPKSRGPNRNRGHKIGPSYNGASISGSRPFAHLALQRVATKADTAEQLRCQAYDRRVVTRDATVPPNKTARPFFVGGGAPGPNQERGARHQPHKRRRRRPKDQMVDVLCHPLLRVASWQHAASDALYDVTVAACDHAGHLSYNTWRTIVDTTLQRIDAARDTNQSVLIACGAGVNLGPSLACAYLMHSRRMGAQAALDLLESKNNAHNWGLLTDKRYRSFLETLEHNLAQL